MITPRVAAVARTPISGSNRSQKSLSNKRKSTPYGNLNFSRQSLLSPSIPQHRNQSFSHSYGTQFVIEETQNYIVENYGVSLPVLVTEVLTVAEKGAHISVKLSECGWAWLVYGRRLFIWKYAYSSGPRMLSSQCRELTLPPSELKHKADLVCVFLLPDSQVPLAIAVSPEGLVRYWPSIAHEGSSIETSAELHGQECYSLINAMPLGCILATTTSTLVQVIPTSLGGQSTLICRHLKVPQGMLTGIGRRVSSFIFGSLPNQTSESKLVKVLITNTEQEDEKNLFVLTGNNLQKWHLISHEPDKLLFECDVERFVKEKFCEQLWGADAYGVNQSHVWLIDMQLMKNQVVLLAAGMNMQISHQVYYMLGVLNFQDGLPVGFSHFIISKFTEYYQEGDEEALCGYRLLIERHQMQSAFIYKDRTILCISMARDTDEPEKIEFNSPSDKILGAGLYNGIPLFFSNNDGIISIMPSDHSQRNESFATNVTAEFVRSAEHISFSEEFMQAENAMTPKDPQDVKQLKAAFLLFCKQNQSASQNIVDSLFPPSLTSVPEVDNSLNMSIVAISQDLIDDYPASDPRWAESVGSVPDSVTSTSLSMIVLHQLEDKQKAHEVYMNFLKSVNLWNKMYLITERDKSMPTRLLLREHAEKLAAAMMLRNLQSQHNAIIEKAIKLVQQRRNEFPTGKLTHQDLFYREVSRIHEIILALISCEESTVDSSLQEYVKTVLTTNNIIEAILKEASIYRNSKSSMYPITTIEPDIEYVPWTSSGGTQGIRTLLIKQHSVTMDLINQGVEDVHTRGALFQQLVDLADLVLDGYRIQLESISNTDDAEHYRSVMQHYQEDRTLLINPLLKSQQYDRAAALAEKYCDFGILVRLCEETGNQERLQRYMAQFADKDFSDFVFKWYLEKGKRGKLLSQPISHQEELQRFLEQHQSLSWLQQIHSRNYTQAQATLKNLAIAEKDILSKKKTLFSLSKLAVLVSDEDVNKISEKIEEINHEQELIIHQESLPAAILDSFGFDPDCMRVMTPKELIELYIGPENHGSNEFDFKKALDLLHYVDKSDPSTDLEELKLHIWCRAVLKDRWSDIDTDNPFESCSSTIFFKTVDLIFAEGLDLQEYLPSLDDLLNAEELGNLKELAEFKFLIKAGYEYMQKLIS